VPFSPPFNHKTKFFSPSHVGSLALTSLVNSVVCLVLISRTRISDVFEWDSNEYVETVNKANVPAALGIAADLLGADKSTMWRH